MSDKCTHCTEVQVRLDLQMEIARLEAELDNARATIERLNQRIAELEAENQWHPASEPPAHMNTVLIVTDHCMDDMYTGYYHVHLNRWMSGNNGRVTHWREMPKFKEPK